MQAACNEHEESEFSYHTSCEACGSSDAKAVYTDGHGYCFACPPAQAWTPPADKPPTSRRNNSMPSNTADQFSGFETTALTARGITFETVNKFGYQLATSIKTGERVQLAYYYKNGTRVATHARTRDKQFFWLGDSKGCELFGQHLWRDGGKRVVVTEGEIDCMSVSQVQGNKWAVVSVPSGASGAKKALQANLEWLEQFEEVVLCFDNDKAGQEAVEACTPLFTPNKCKVATLPLKDANEMLKSGRGADLINALWSAKTYRPDGVVGFDQLKEAMEAPIEVGLSFPWDTLSELTYGIPDGGAIITLGSGSGMGKSETWKEIMHHLVTVHKQHVGGIFMEETPQHTMTCLLGKEHDKRFHIPNDGWTIEEYSEAINSNSTLEGKVFLFDHRSHNDYETIKSRIRYMVVSCGCRYIFLDHVTALVQGDLGDKKVHEALGTIMKELAGMTVELNFNLFLISHLNAPEGTPHEEGGRVTMKNFYGSSAIKQWSYLIFGLEGNQQAETKEDRNKRTLRCLKDRLTGQATGSCVQLYYNDVTGRLLEDTTKRTPAGAEAFGENPDF